MLHSQKTTLLAVACVFGLFVSGQAASERVTLPGHVPPAVARLAPKFRLPATNVLSLAIGLPLRNEEQLDDLLHQLYDPGSTNFHKFLTGPQLTARFGATDEEYQAIVDFASSNGLAISGSFSNHLVLGVTGRAADVERAFQISLHTYRHPTEPRDFFAPATEPSVPPNLKVISVEGLSDFSLPRHARLQTAGAIAQPSAFNGSGPNHEYAGIDFRNAYAPGSTLTGAGQSLAVLEFSDYFPVDITNYENTIGAVVGVTNYVPLVNVVVGGVSPSTANNLEVALDIEVALSLAPMLSQIYVYEKNTVSSTLLNQIATDNLAKQVSSSWTVGNWSSSLATSYDNILKTMAAQGQSYFQASGDHDAYTGAEPLDSGITVPADSPYATIVGGTTLSMSGTGAAWSAETVWNYNTSGSPNEGSGGGISVFYAEPFWQTNISMAANAGSTSKRNIPDVALTADDIYISYNNGNFSGAGYAVGTSAAAPLWAAFCALANQLSVASNGTTLGFLNPALYNIAVSSCYPRSFHDITTGSNIGTNTPGLFNAVPGYDLATGLGTPAGTNLINALVWPPPTFTAQPVGRIVTNGVNVTFTAAASSSTPMAYFWLCNRTNLAASGNVSGTTTGTLSISAATTNNSGSYQLVASNFTGSVTSLVAVLNVGFVPAVSVAPATLTVLAGSNAVFTATPGGTAPFGFAWQKNGTNFAGSGISGTNASVLTLVGVTTNSAANYFVVVTNLFGSITSSAVALTVVLPPVITSSSLTNLALQCGSNNVTFGVAATGTLPLSYQWSLDGAAVSSATNTSFSVTNLHLPNHTVSVQITNLYASLSSNAVLTVQDSIGPAISLNGSNLIILELGSTFADPGATAVDLCAGPVPVTPSGAVNLNAAGTNTVLYTATDGSGNTNTALRTVVIRDTTPPVIAGSFTNLVLAAGANCTALMPDVTGTNFVQATDLSGVTLVSQVPTNNAPLPLGTNLVVITVADPSGNTAYSTNRIIVLDQTPPVIVLNGSNPLTNELGAVFTDPGVTVSDCSGIALLTTNGVVNVSVIGTSSLAYTAVDTVGNTNTASRTVVIRDTTPPVIVGSFTNLVLAAGANCTASMPDVTGTNFIQATDLSGVASVSQVPTSNTPLPLGTNLVVISVADAYGNTAHSTNHIIVLDQTPPVIVLNGSNPLTNELGVVFTDPGVTVSDCSSIASMITNGAVNVSVVGTNSLAYIAVDSAGNTNTALRTVVIRDTTPPVIVGSFTNLVLAAGANCTASMPDVTGTNFVQATDLSGVASVSQVPTNNAPLPLGTNVAVVAVADPYGNTAFSTNYIVVLDQTPPVIVLNGSNPLTNELGAVFTDPGVTASDCSGIALLTTNGAVNVSVVGTNSLAYIAVDSVGNTNTVSRTVVIRDTTPPIIVESFTNLVLADGANCTTSMPDVTGTNFVQATDLSSVVSVSQVPTNNAPLPLGTNVVVVAVADPYGNTAYSTNQIVVLDQTPPILVLNGPNPLTNELGAIFTDPGVAASDCSGITLLTTNGVVNTSAVGTNTIAYTAVDGAGNTNTAARIVVVVDTTAPAILWSFTNMVVAAGSNCFAVMPDVTGTNYVLAADLTGVAAVSQMPTNGTPLPLGTNIVVIAVADPYGNTAYSTNQMVVQDVLPPSIQLNGFNPMTNELGAPFVDPGFNASDACSGIARLVTNGAVQVAVVGTNLLTYIAVDGAGNTNAATRMVVVLDTTPPALVWCFTNLVLAANSNCVAGMPAVTATNYLHAADVSGIASISQSPTNGEFLPLGTNLVVVTATDLYGNTACATNAIVVQDQSSPSIVTQPQSQTNTVGATVTLSLAVTACTPLAFQWLFNDLVLTAETNRTLVISNLAASAAGNYTVIIRSDGGSVTSSVATLTVYVLPGISTIAGNRNGTMALNLTGSPGAAYVLESATNLAFPINWLDLATNTLGTNGVWQFTDFHATNFPRQFYRFLPAP